MFNIATKWVCFFIIITYIPFCKSVLSRPSTTAQSTVNLVFFPGGDGFETLVKELKRARERIDLGLFYLTHDTVIDILCYKMSRSGGSVQVRLFLDGTMGNPTYKEDLQRLIRAGAEIYLEDLPRRGKIHTKFGVIDRKTVITGTANWTKFGLGEKGDSSNFEDLVFLKDEKIAQNYLNALEEIKQHCTPYLEKYPQYKEGLYTGKKEKYKFPTKKEYQISNRIKARNKSRDTRKFMLKTAPQAYFTPANLNDDKKPVFEKIIKSIKQAQNKIEIYMYAISDDDVEDAVISAIDRGVETTVVADEWMASGRMRDVLQKFYEAGANVFYYHKLHGSMHLKCMVIDEKIIWRGSGNWTGSAGTKNFEDFMKIESEKMAKFYGRIFAQIQDGAVEFIGEKKTKSLANISEEDKKLFEWQEDGDFQIGLPPARIRKTKADFDVFGDLEDNEYIELDGETRYLDDEQYHPMLVHLIKNAKQSIVISMYLAAYREKKKDGKKTRKQPYLEKIITELEKASKRGIYVYAVFEVSGNPDSGYEKHHTPLVARLRKSGVDARLDVPTMGMHDKMLIVDLSKVIIGSHNWSEGALSGKSVQESSVFIACNRQYPELAEYITDKKVIYNMAKPKFWQEEIATLRRLQAMKRKDRKRKIKEIEKNHNNY